MGGEPIHSRLHWPDIAKGIGILLVVIAHTSILPSSIIKWIFSFHVPVFFFISGYFYRRYHFKKFIIKKSRSLLKPYFEYSLLFLIVDFVIEGEEFFAQIANRLFDVFSGNYNALWFLVALYICEIVFYLIDNISNTEAIKIGIVFIFVVAGSLLIYFKVELPFRFINAIMMLPFFYAGQLMKKCLIEDKIKGKLLAGITITLAINIGFGCLNSFSDVRTNEYGNLLFFYLSAMAGSFMLSISAITIGQCGLVEIIGRNTLCIFALNTFIPSRLSKLAWIPGGLIRRMISVALLVVAVAISEWKKQKKKAIEFK